MSDNVLVIRLHPVGGEDVSVISRDFAGEAEALQEIARELDERRSLILQARYNREADENAVVVNLANVVSVRVSNTGRHTDLGLDQKVPGDHLSPADLCAPLTTPAVEASTGRAAPRPAT